MSDLLYEVKGPAGWITFNRPAQRNALTLAMYQRLKEIAQGIEPGGPVRALVMTGAGDRAFAAGTDMNEFADLKTPEDAFAYEDGIGAVVDALERCPVPIIAAMTGACTGGGAALAAVADLRICDQGLKYGFPIARTLGNGLAIGVHHRLSRLLGPGRAKEIILTARLIGAAEALSCGLVSETLPDAAATRGRAQALAETLAGHAPLTLMTTKEAHRRLLTEGPDAPDRDLIETVYMSADFQEGKEAFLTKRAPVWKGV